MTTSAATPNREAWLTELARRLEPLFAERGHDLAGRYRVTCSWPSKRALSAKKRAVGEAWSPDCSRAKVAEVCVSLLLDEPVAVADVLVHELVHVAVGNKCGHRGPFVRLARALGLEGKPTSTTMGAELKGRVLELMVGLPPYPHAGVDAVRMREERKPDGTRMIKVACGDCGYTVRATRKWLDVAVPDCPNPLCGAFGREMEAA